MPAFLRLRTGCDRDALAKTRRAQTGVKRVPTQGLGRTHEQTQRRVKRAANGAIRKCWGGMGIELRRIHRTWIWDGAPKMAQLNRGLASPAKSQGVATIQEAGTYGVRPLPAYFRCALTSLVSSNIVT